MALNNPNVRIFEVGPRDGLQNIKTAIPTAAKIELIKRLSETGLRDIEITSVVSPKAIPQLSDNQKILGDESIQNLIRDYSNRMTILVPNAKGLERGMQQGVKDIAVFVSATEGFSKANINCTVEAGLQRASEVASTARKNNIRVRGYISCIFQDPFDGPTPEAAVFHCVQKLLGMGCYEVSLGDTLGVGTAADVRRLLQYLYDHGIAADRLAGHFHDTYGQAVSNVWAAYEFGVRTFDSSVGGLGGCPFCPGAKGNVATEELVYLFEGAGISTGVNLQKLAQVGAWISNVLKKDNDSRAGAALAVKSGMATQEQLASSKRASIAWQVAPKQPENIQILRSGTNLKIVLDRPKIGNALTASMIAALKETFATAATDNTISRIAITANGKFFCTGMDLGKSSPVAKNEKESEAQYERLHGLFRIIAESPKVTIAAVNGPAFGGGVGLAFACDVRIGVVKSSFTLSEVKLGLSPATISKYVIKEWGQAFTREAMLSARAVPFPQLLGLGVVTQVVDSIEDLDAALDEYLTRLKVAAPRASALSKELIRASEPGKPTQATQIYSVFKEMMAPGGESAYGLREFQAGNRDIDWDAYVLKRAESRL